MRRRLFLVLAIATVVGLFTGAIIYRTVSRSVTRQADRQATEQVVVAAVNMELGESLTRQHIELATWPENSVPEGAIKSFAEAEGLVTRSSMVSGEPVLRQKLVDPQKETPGGVLPMIVPEGLRGVTIKVDRAVQESGFIMPHSRVDVLVSMDKGDGDQIAKTILQNVPVLAAGQSVEMKDNKPVKITTVTVALTPEQAERLALAQTSGKLMLATRNYRDEQSIQTVGVTRTTLLGPSEATPKSKASKSRVADSAPLPAPKIKAHVVSVLRAGQATEVTFVRDTGKNMWVKATPR